MRNLLATTLACAVIVGRLGSATAGSSRNEFDWSFVQTCGMLPLDPEEAAEKGWTVNGLWGGFAMPEAVRSVTHVVGQESPERAYPITWSYPTMKDYIDANHAAGLLVPATLFGIGGDPMPRARFPEMEQGACVGTDGERSYWEPGTAARYFMCANNPIHGEVLLTLGKEAIDAGADLIVIDEIQGNEFCFLWSNQPGFCEHCLAAYRKHLGSIYTPEELRDKFGIADLERFDFANCLDGQREKGWNGALPLFRELWFLQERLNFEAKRKLVNGLRTHMREKGRMIPIFCNTPSVGLQDFNGIRLTSLKWASVCDSIAFENMGPEWFFLLPRGKWVAYERLAAAAFKLPPAILIHNGLVVANIQGDFLAGKNRSVYCYGLLAEANANGCHFVNYYMKQWFPETEPLWKDTFRGQRFILQHRDLFEVESDRGANVGVLFIENEGQRFRTWSFVGMCQALAESNIPFDVLIDGDGGYIPVTLSADALRKYQLVIIPQALFLTHRQKEAVEAYVLVGGAALIADPEEFGISPREIEVARGTGTFAILPKVNVPARGSCDLAMAYCLTYEEAMRRQIADAVNKRCDTVLEVLGVDRTVCVYPYFQPAAKRIVLHMVNLDYIPDEDRMRPKENITVRLRRPPFLTNVGEARIYSPDFPADASELRLKPTVEGDFIELVVPKLDVYNVVVLSG